MARSKGRGGEPGQGGGNNGGGGGRKGPGTGRARGTDGGVASQAGRGPRDEEAQSNQADAISRGTMHNAKPQQSGHGSAGAHGPGGKS